MDILVWKVEIKSDHNNTEKSTCWNHTSQAAKQIITDSFWPDIDNLWPERRLQGGCDTLGVNIIASGSVITAPSCQTKTRRKKWLISTFSSLGCYFWQTLPNVAIFRVRWFLLEKCDYISYNIYFNVFYSPNVWILWSLLIFVNL